MSVVQLMSDEKCAKYVDGVAVHWYLDFIVPVKVLNEVHKDFGDKIIMNTEASQGLSLYRPCVYYVFILVMTRARKFMHSLFFLLVIWNSC